MEEKELVSRISENAGCMTEERDSVPSAPTYDRDKVKELEHEIEATGDNRFVEFKAAAPTASVPTLEEEAREWRVTQWHVSSAAKIAPSQLHKYLALTTDQLDSMLAAFVRQRRKG